MLIHSIGDNRCLCRLHVAGSIYLGNKHPFLRDACPRNGGHVSAVCHHRLIESSSSFIRLGNSFRLKTTYHRAFSNYYMFIREYQQAYEHNELEYQQYHAHPQFKDELAMSYKICVANLISRAQTVKKTERFLELITELKELPISSFNEEGEVFQNVYFSEHLPYINTGEFEKAEALVPVIEEGLIIYRNKINRARVLSFQYNIMVMYFVMHRFKEALNWTNMILEDKSELKQNMQDVSRILLPFIHFELGHYDLVENLTRSSYRYLLKKERLHSFERLVVNYLKEMPLSVDQTEFSTKLELFTDALKLLFDDPKETVTLGMEEMKLWAESKMTNVRMHVILTKDTG